MHKKAVPTIIRKQYVLWLGQAFFCFLLMRHYTPLCVVIASAIITNAHVNRRFRTEMESLFIRLDASLIYYLIFNNGYPKTDQKSISTFFRVFIKFCHLYICANLSIFTRKILYSQRRLSPESREVWRKNRQVATIFPLKIYQSLLAFLFMAAAARFPCRGSRFLSRQ